MTEPPLQAAAPRRSFATGALSACGRFFFRFRDAVLPVTLVVLAVATMPRIPPAHGPGSGATVPYGIALSLLGQIWRALAIGLVYIQRGGRNRRIYADDLVTDGMFSVCRNPLYVGNIAIQCGLLLVLDSRLAYWIGIPFVLFVYAAIVAAEEDFLRARFGAAYEAYCADVHRWLPSLRRLPAALRSTKYDVRRLLRKEYGATAAWMTMCCALILWKSLYQQVPAHPRGPIVVVAWCCVGIAYVIVRALKKAGQLG